MEKQTTRTIFIGNLHPSTTEKDLLTIFSRYGTIVKINYLWHKTGQFRGQPRGFAFIEYQQENSVMNALQQNGSTIRGRQVVVKLEKAGNWRSDDPSPYSILRKRTHEEDGSTAENEVKTTRVLKAVKSIDDKIAKLKSKQLQLNSTGTTTTTTTNPTATTTTATTAITAAASPPPPATSVSSEAGEALESKQDR